MALFFILTTLRHATSEAFKPDYRDHINRPSRAVHSNESNSSSNLDWKKTLATSLSSARQIYRSYLSSKAGRNLPNL